VKHITCYECFPPRSGKHYFLAGKPIHTRTDCPPNTIYFLNKSDMKHLKKHPKQQRMEEMTFPITKPLTSSGPLRVRTITKTFINEAGNIPVFNDLASEDQKKIINEAMKRSKKLQDVKIWTGREYLRSINDDNGFTLMPRIVWRVVAVVILVIICLVIIL